MNSDGTDPQCITETATYQPAWSPAGDRIAFNNGNEGEGIFVVDVDGSNLVRIGDLASPKELYPVWSPRADRIAFTSDRAGHYDIYVMGADGSGLVRLTHPASSD